MRCSLTVQVSETYGFQHSVNNYRDLIVRNIDDLGKFIYTAYRCFKGKVSPHSSFYKELKYVCDTYCFDFDFIRSRKGCATAVYTNFEVESKHGLSLDIQQSMLPSYYRYHRGGYYDILIYLDNRLIQHLGPCYKGKTMKSQFYRKLTDACDKYGFVFEKVCDDFGIEVKGVH